MDDERKRAILAEARAHRDGTWRPPAEPIGSPPMQKKDASAALIYKQREDATGDAAAGEECDWSGWERWMEGHKALLREELLESFAKAMVLMIEARAVAPLEKKIRQLERKLVRKGR